MKTNHTLIRSLTTGACGMSLTILAACTPMMAGQVTEAGYNAARTALGGAPAGADERQQKLQAIMNGIEIGQDVSPVLAQIGEPPKIKSGNAYGYTCYEFASVYAADEDAVIVAQEGKIVFYGSSRCSSEMQDANFKQDGKYMGGKLPQAGAAAADESPAATQ